MQKVDGTYIYELGAALRPIASLPEVDTSPVQTLFALNPGKFKLSEFIYGSIFSESFRATARAAVPLLELLERLIPVTGPNTDWTTDLPAYRFTEVKREFSRFEAVLLAELKGSDIYYVSAKGGFDTVALTERGEVLFPASLGSKVPDAVEDIKAGARCLAFELPTAAAFHFHRANEAVLRVYFDHVARGVARPRSNNMGEYLNIMKTQNLGDQKVLEVLQAIKNLHRNPIMHPEARLSSTEEAISLMAAIRAAIGYMLDRINDAPPPVIAPLPLEAPIQPASA